MQSKLDRCTGHCCTDIGLPISPEALRDSYRRWKRAGDPRLVMANEAHDVKIYGDIELTYPMLRFLRKDRIHPEVPWQESENDIYHYECKHYDKEKRECSIYEDRPYMCSSYPNKDYCANPGCTWDKVCSTRPEHVQADIDAFLKDPMMTPRPYQLVDGLNKELVSKTEEAQAVESEKKDGV